MGDDETKTLSQFLRGTSAPSVFLTIILVCLFLFGISFLIGNSLAPKSLINENVAFAFKIAEATILVILSLFLIVQRKFDSANGSVQILGAAIYSLTLFTSISVIQNQFLILYWLVTFGAILSGLILNAVWFWPTIQKSTFLKHYPLILSLLATSIAILLMVYPELLPNIYLPDLHHNPKFVLINQVSGVILLIGCGYFAFRYSRKEKDRIFVNFLVAYFTLIGLTRLFITFTQKQDIQWWFIIVMRSGASIFAVYYLITTFRRTLFQIEIKNQELLTKNDLLLAEAIKTYEKQRIIEDQRAKMFYSAQMASIAKLSGVIAHEVNSPITSISLNTEFILKRGQGVLDEEHQKRLQHIHKLTLNVSDIIKRFLALSNLRESVESENVFLKDILSCTLKMCGSTFSNDINLTVDEIPNVKIFCRQTHLTQALLNLLLNSFDAVQTLQDKWVQIRFEETEDKILIKVIDSGKGIPKEILDKIMEPFFTTKDVNEGTGLGLSISKSYIEEQKGTLYYLEDMSNTCFVIELPKV